MKISSLLRIALSAALLLPGTYASAQKQFSLRSPDGKIAANIYVGKTIEYSVTHEKDIMLERSPISMTIDGGKTVFGEKPKLQGSSSRFQERSIDSPVYKRKAVEDNFSELILRFKDGFNLVFRAYDEGIAYRFVSNLKNPFTVENEKATFKFPSDSRAYIPYAGRKGPFEEQFYNSFENTYSHSALSEWETGRLAFLPMVVEGANGKKVCITEADLTSYPGMFMYNGNGSTTLTGVFAPYPKDIEQGGHNMLQGIVRSRESYIAKYGTGSVEFPWRIVIVSGEDHELADNDMVYKLASPSKINDTSWIKPGKVAWDWWNAWNIYGVDFKAGINNETYKYYIDFAAEYGIEYVILDEGWSVNREADLMQVVPEIDLKELVSYASGKNVGLILWAGYYTLARDIEGICRHYSEMGIKGFKVDFMDRDDQPMADFHYHTAETAAKYKLMIDFHGTYKPTGLQRTFPNVVNFEGVFGLEQMKWSDANVDMVTYDVIVPFVRMVAGPMDYTQGAMRNAAKGNYRPVDSEAMSQGTRCRQLAEYVIFESPLNMLCDSPSNYMSEKECTGFIAGIPTVWDNTLALNGKISEYVTIAREKNGVWYVGSMTNWDARELELDLSFLGHGSFKAEIFRDGVNADRAGRDYKREVVDIPSDRKFGISMAPGGGFVMKVYRE